MKEPSRAQGYALIYHGLCSVARKLGYALAMHGSMATDLDLIAIPWTDDAAPADDLAMALLHHCDACLTPIGTDAPPVPVWTEKPHGRRALNLYMDPTGQVDLSVMPRMTL